VDAKCFRLDIGHPCKRIPDFTKNFAHPSAVCDWLHIVPRKTRHKRKDVVQKPVLPVLARIISETPIVGSESYLVTQYGKPPLAYAP
jgi:hypothetical protein